MFLYKKSETLKRIYINATLSEPNKRYCGGTLTIYLPQIAVGASCVNSGTTLVYSHPHTDSHSLTMPKLTPREFHSFTRRNHHRIAMHRLAAVRACCFCSWGAKETLAHNFTLKKMHMQHVRAIQCCTTFRFRLLPPFRPQPACN